jgi:hypothetical protein
MLTKYTNLTIKMILNGYQIQYINDAEAYKETVITWEPTGNKGIDGLRDICNAPQSI